MAASAMGCPCDDGWVRTDWDSMTSEQMQSHMPVACLECGVIPIGRATRIPRDVARAWLWYFAELTFCPDVSDFHRDLLRLYGITPDDHKNKLASVVDGLPVTIELWSNFGDLGKNLVRGIAHGEPDPRIAAEAGIIERLRSLSARDVLTCDGCGAQVSCRDIALHWSCPHCEGGPFEGLDADDIGEIIRDNAARDHQYVAGIEFEFGEQD